MQSDSKTMTITPPRLISSLAAGFNTVANHVYLILFPITLDLLLWLGPHVRIKALFEPFVAQFPALLAGVNVTDQASLISTWEELWKAFLEHFNLLSLLRVYPIGVPSLFSSTGPIATPLGSSPVIELNSVLGLFAAWLVLTGLGIAGGTLFFSEIARNTEPDRVRFSFRRYTWQFVQILLLAVALVVILIIFSIPTSIMLTVLMMFSPSVAQISLFFLVLLLLWLLVPLVFAPHGIFVYQQNVLTSMRTSMHLVRYFLPGTGIFLLVALLLGSGMDILWRVPAENSWMALVGIFGHAFVSTGLLSASFIYYLGGIRWMKDSLERIGSKNARV